MDPASAIIGIVSFGFTVIGKINQIRKAIKDAPDQLQALQDSSVAVSLLLSRLRVSETDALTPSPQIDACFESLRKRADRCLQEVNTIVDKVIDNGRGNETFKIRLKQWFRNKGNIDDLSRKITEVRKALCELLEFLQTRYIEKITGRVINIDRNVNVMAIFQLYQLGLLRYIAGCVNNASQATNTRPIAQERQIHRLIGTTEAVDDARHEPLSSASGHRTIPENSSPSDPRNTLNQTYPLQCLPSCNCHCHYPSMIQLLPVWLASFVGQIFVSNRLLHPWGWLSSLCNVQTCRGDFKRVMMFQWRRPPTQSSYGAVNFPGLIHFSIILPRVIPADSPIFTAVGGPVEGVRRLFNDRKASIWDRDPDGLSVFWWACRHWQNGRTERKLEVLRYLVSLGADHDTLLFEGKTGFLCAHDLLAQGSFGYLLGDLEEGRSISTLARTNEVSINIFRALFDLDPIDALEDYLTRQSGHSTDIRAFMKSLENPACNTQNSSRLLETIGYTPLRYALSFWHWKVIPLLDAGADASAEPSLVYAVNCVKFELIKPLLDAGAKVNMTNSRGYTALLSACSMCYYDAFSELVRWSENDIDWNVRTLDGQNALDLLELGILDGEGPRYFKLTQTALDQFRRVLVDHMDCVGVQELVCDEQSAMPGAFPGAT